MTYLNEATIKQLQTYFQDVDKDVTLVLFNAPDAPYGEETEQVLRELADVSPHFALDVLDLEEDQDRAEAYGVTRAPAYVLLDETGTFTRVRFNGAPMGHEINALISALAEVGGGAPAMPEALRERVEAIDHPVAIKVFVTVSCPHCPGAVQKAHALALHNPKIEAEMIELSSFPDLAREYGVRSVPHIFFNDDANILGNQPFETFIETAEQA